jgi:Icc-related predicted phosphoesterase
VIRPIDTAVDRIGLAGDWERDARWARGALAAFAGRGIEAVFHLGDFGIWPGGRGRQYLSEVDGTLRGHRQTLYLTPGNHDDYNQINELPALDDGLQWLTERIAVIPRGHRWTLGGRIWVSLGGAPSVDYPQRIEGETWWPEEAITDDDVQRVVDGGHADVMLCHDAPTPGTPAVERIIRTGGGWSWTERGLRYAREGRARLTRAVDAVQPSLLVHGHYHVADAATVAVGDREREIVSLSANGQHGNLAVLDLAADTLAWEWVDVPG